MKVKVKVLATAAAALLTLSGATAPAFAAGPGSGGSGAGGPGGATSPAPAASLPSQRAIKLTMALFQDPATRQLLAGSAVYTFDGRSRLSVSISAALAARTGSVTILVNGSNVGTARLVAGQVTSVNLDAAATALALRLGPGSTIRIVDSATGATLASGTFAFRI
jgi:hypothetical protein